jgi:hypothetical protein
MGMQEMINSMNESQARTRSSYHLTYGDLVKALLAAPPEAEFDPRVKGIGSWRGSYIEIALFTESAGYHANTSEYHGNYEFDDYDKWQKESVLSEDDLPRNANELGMLLKSLIGKYFTGYKGGNFLIEEYKPLWLETDGSTCESVAIVGIDKDLNLVTKQTED